MTHSSKPSSYSRFIPKEEINAVATWRFANVDGTPHPEDLPPPEAVPTGPTPEEIDQLVDEARQQARAEGYALGHAAGSEETRQALEVPLRETNAQAAARFQSALEELNHQIADLHDDLSSAVLEMACALAKQVIRRELSVDPQALQPVVKEALDQLVDDSLPAVVRLHPQDLAAMEAAWTDMPPSSRPRFVTDPTIQPGGCRIESTHTSVDATLPTRWARTVANLGVDMPWDDDHAEAPQS